MERCVAKPQASLFPSIPKAELKRGSKRSFSIIKSVFHSFTSCLNSRNNTLCWHSQWFFLLLEGCLTEQSSHSGNLSSQCRDVCSSLYSTPWWLFSYWQALNWNFCALNLHLAVGSSAPCLLIYSQRCSLTSAAVRTNSGVTVTENLSWFHCSAPLAEGKCPVEALRSLEKKLWLFCWWICDQQFLLLECKV